MVWKKSVDYCRDVAIFVRGKVSKEIERQKRRRLSFWYGEDPVNAILYKVEVPQVTRVPERKLKQAYLTSPAADVADTFVLYRIIGNDLPPRHSSGQTRSNVRFILENEPQFPDCEKRWIVNRIHDPKKEEAIVSLLEEYSQNYLTIPFELDAYKQAKWSVDGLPSRDFFFTRKYAELDEEYRFRIESYVRREKNIYAINNNGARNAALTDGKQRAKWILPFDGNCFLTKDSFAELRRKISSKPWLPYFIVPMIRAEENSDLEAKRLVDGAPIEEPQIAFRYDAQEEFDAQIPYGRRPKVEMLWRLGVPGPWDRYLFHPWDHTRPQLAEEAGQTRQAGWVIRLASGRPEQESADRGAIKRRGARRDEAIVARLDELDGRALARMPSSTSPIYYDTDKIVALRQGGDLAVELRDLADQALMRGPYSVVDKSDAPPSRDKHDYWHPSPYWWPNTKTEDGFPFVLRDGIRAPGTSLYEAGNEKFDRTRLQYLFDDVTTLALANLGLDDDRYGRHAATLVKHWFLDEATRMNPHLEYAQVIPDSTNQPSRGHGIIEFKDIFYFLDAVRILTRGKFLSQAEIDGLREWLIEYVAWLEESPQGVREAHSPNNHGTFYDLQLGAIGAYLGDLRICGLIANRAKQRIALQFEPDGSQPHELRRTRPRHYVCFNIAGWALITHLFDAFDDDPLNEGSLGASLTNGMTWLAGAETNQLWPRDDLTPFDPARKLPLWAFCHRRNLIIPGIPPHAELDAPTVFHPDYAIPPFWMLAK